MQYKRIVFTEPKVAKLLDYELCDPADNEVQVRLCVSSISSGTERANLVGSDTTAWDKPPRPAVFPRMIGYSSAGIIEKVGALVSNFKAGDKVAVWWGTHSEVLNISEKNVCLIDDISFEESALFHIATFPLAAIRKCQLEMGESAIVMGMGILGLIAIKLLKAAGAVPIIAVDPSKQKREKALACGADFALDPYADDFAKTVKEITNGGAKVGIEVTGIGAGLDGILDCMARFGRVALLGCTRNSNFNIDYYRKVHGPGITLIGAHANARPKTESHTGYWTQWDDMQALKKLVEMNRLSLSDMIDETFSPEQATEVYTRLANESTFPIAQFDWRKLK